MFNPNMTLEYADDATSMETEVEIIDPKTGEVGGFVADNLTTAMYFIVENGLKPIREGLKEPGKLQNTEGLNELAGVPGGEVLKGFRAQNNLPMTLFIQVHGDPSLADVI